VMSCYINCYSVHVVYDLQMHVISVFVIIVTPNSNTEVFTDTIAHKVLKNLNISYSIYLEHITGSHSCPVKLIKNC
jgi:hypothetical protein